MNTYFIVIYTARPKIK